MVRNLELCPTPESLSFHKSLKSGRRIDTRASTQIILRSIDISLKKKKKKNPAPMAFPSFVFFFKVFQREPPDFSNSHQSQLTRDLLCHALLRSDGPRWKHRGQRPLANSLHLPLRPFLRRSLVGNLIYFFSCLFLGLYQSYFLFLLSLRCFSEVLFTKPSPPTPRNSSDPPCRTSPDPSGETGRGNRSVRFGFWGRLLGWFTKIFKHSVWCCFFAF